MEMPIVVLMLTANDVCKNEWTNNGYRGKYDAKYPKKNIQITGQCQFYIPNFLSANTIFGRFFKFFPIPIFVGMSNYPMTQECATHS